MIVAEFLFAGQRNAKSNKQRKKQQRNKNSVKQFTEKIRYRNTPKYQTGWRNSTTNHWQIYTYGLVFHCDYSKLLCMEKIHTRRKRSEHSNGKGPWKGKIKNNPQNSALTFLSCYVYYKMWKNSSFWKPVMQKFYKNLPTLHRT